MWFHKCKWNRWYNSYARACKCEKIAYFDDFGRVKFIIDKQGTKFVYDENGKQVKENKE